MFSKIKILSIWSLAFLTNIFQQAEDFAIILDIPKLKMGQLPLPLPLIYDQRSVGVR